MRLSYRVAGHPRVRRRADKDLRPVGKPAAPAAGFLFTDAGVALGFGVQPSEHDAEKYEAVSDDIMLYLFDLEPDSDFRSTRPEIIRL